MAELYTPLHYPLPSDAALKLQYIGKSLQDVETPAAVINRAIVKRNCQAMLDVAEKLGVGFRAHVKSHKTLELSKLQVGEGEKGPANFIVSTLHEAEQLAPFILECHAKGRDASILYGVPLPPSKVPRLLKLAKIFQKPSTINILIDNSQTLHPIQELLSKETTNTDIGVFIKLDTGYGRAGVDVESPTFHDLLSETAALAQETPFFNFQGFYSHLGNSYGGSTEDDATDGLIREIEGVAAAAKIARDKHGCTNLTLSVGATPTATAAQNLLRGEGQSIERLSPLIAEVTAHSNLELHAGVYPLLDLQQVATHARPSTASPTPGFQPLNPQNIGLRILTEVSSLYSTRDKPEALISAGSLALGREPCKSYPGWGILSPFPDTGTTTTYYNPSQKEKRGWIVGRISQEHGILSWEGEKEGMRELRIGEKVMVWPNHACVAGAGFGWYLVVDGEEGGEKIVDVWVRWRGW